MEKRYLSKIKDKEKVTIVTIGDSTTSQEWCKPSWYDWINFKFRQNLYEGSTNFQMFNSGIDGGDVDHYLDNFHHLIGKLEPTIVILSFGFNEIENPTNYKSKLTTLVNKIKEIGSEVICWSTYETINPKYSEALEKCSATKREVCEKTDSLFIDIYNEFKKYKLETLFTYTHQWENELWDIKPGEIDFLHCNTIGNQIIAEKILLEAFSENLDFISEWEKYGNGMGEFIKHDLNNYLL